MEADFTYVWTAEGWLYVAAVIDLFSRRVVGWSMNADVDIYLIVLLEMFEQFDMLISVILSFLFSIT